MISYLVLAHHSPPLLRRMMAQLDGPDVRFFIHIDRKSEFGPFKWALSEFEDPLPRLYHRIDTRWGEYSLVEASLFLLREALEHAPGTDRFVLLSGQSYPIKTREQIETSLYEADSTTYIDCAPLPAHLRHRIDRHYFSIRGWQRVYPPFKAPRTARERFLNGIFGRCFRMPRAFPAGLTPFYGSQWWCMSRKTAGYVIEFVKERPDFVRHQKHSHVPDEMFFQTILGNAAEGLDDAIIRRSLHLAIWKGDDQPSPAVLGEEHFDRLRSSDCLFARKFDITQGADVLDRVDRELLNAT